MKPSDNEGNLVQDHGGNVWAESGGVHVVRDFSASINPLGHPDGMLEALTEAWPEVLHYPDRNADRLVTAIAEHHGLDETTVMAGNGSAELIDLLLRGLAPKRLLVCPPDFSLYKDYVPAGVKVVTVPRKEQDGFAVDAEALVTTARPGDLVLFSNPSNPAGTLMPREEILSLQDRLEAKKATLAVDEAFCDFCPEGSVLDQAGTWPELVVLRSMTKFYGIPGIRVGFASGAPETLERMAALQVDWSVSTPAQVCGVHCFSDEQWGARTREYVERSREKLTAELQKLRGFHPLPSAANYLLVRLDPPAPDADTIYHALRAEGTLVRHCSSFGLGNRYIRLAVRTVGQNADLIVHLQKLTGIRQLESDPLPRQEIERVRDSAPPENGGAPR